MQVRFILTMSDLIVDGRPIDQLIIEWAEDLPAPRVMAISRDWLDSNNYLTRHMTGLQQVGESSLTIQPIDETTNTKNRFTI